MFGGLFGRRLGGAAAAAPPPAAAAVPPPAAPSLHDAETRRIKRRRFLDGCWQPSVNLRNKKGKVNSQHTRQCNDRQQIVEASKDVVANIATGSNEFERIQRDAFSGQGGQLHRTKSFYKGSHDKMRASRSIKEAKAICTCVRPHRNISSQCIVCRVLVVSDRSCFMFL